MKNYIQPGDAVTVTAPRDVSSGELVAVGALVGFAQTDALEDESLAIVTTGVFRVTVAAETGDVSTGDVIYLDGQDLTTDDSDGANPRAGVAVIGGAAADGVAEIHLKINA